MKTTISRKNFLRTSAMGAAAVAAPTVIPSSAMGFSGFTAPSNRLAFGFVGFGLIVQGHFRGILDRKDCQVLAVCDVDRKKRETARDRVNDKYGNKDCECYNEHEKLMARDDIDAVYVTTPDHWHVPISLDAVRSGKDVYVEKPMSLTIREGRILADAVKRYGAVLQVGSQQRSEYSFGKAVELVRNGYIGKVHTVYARLNRFPDGVVLPEEPIPEGFDYDRWLGPTPWYPYNRKRVEGNYSGGWRSYWEYGARKNGDWGAHHYDIIQWALGMDHSGPEFFFPQGYDDSGCQGYKYKNGPIVYRDFPNQKFGSMIEFYGDKGAIGVGRSGDLKSDPGDIKNLPLKPRDTHLGAYEGHRDNFLNAIKTRQSTIANVEVGHRTATICHLSAISERLNRTIKWNPETEEIVGDAEASKWLDRPRRAPYTL
ncbi:Gfo/Idh/MocA family protein [Pontiella agarivorans]|nr:Gfo/Idh/MocA family oxidoreductase [Pontiella agarivorans]